MYIVIEAQTENNTTSTLVGSYPTKAEADSKYHTILAYASLSSVPVHSAVMLDSEGHFIKSECYKH